MVGTRRVALFAALVAVVTAVQWLVVDPHCHDALAVMGGTQFQMFQKPPLANDFPMGSLDGQVFSLADLKGKVVLLNFWRKNCPYCAHEKGYLENMVKGLNRPDLQVLCVNLWDSPSWINQRYGRKDEGCLRYATKSDNRRWVVENTVRGRLMGYYVLNEANEAIYEVKGFPSTYVIDKNGRVVATHMGMVDWTSPVVKRWLLRVLGPRPSMNDLQRPEYQLPEWLDRLLVNDVGRSSTHGRNPARRAQLMPHRRDFVSDERSGLVAGPNRW